MEKNEEESGQEGGDTGTEHAAGGGGGHENPGRHENPGHPGEDEQATGNPAAAGTEDPDDS